MIKFASGFRRLDIWSSLSYLQCFLFLILLAVNLFVEFSRKVSLPTSRDEIVCASALLVTLMKINIPS